MGEQVGEVKRVKTGYKAMVSSTNIFQLSAGRASLQHRHGNKGVTHSKSVNSENVKRKKSTLTASVNLNVEL